MLQWFLPYIDRNQSWVYMCSPSWTPSHLLPHPIPQGHPSAPALSTLSHASNLDWRSVSHMIIYMFQYYSLKSSHPRLLPQSPKYCSMFYTSVSLLLSRIQGYHYHISKFHVCVCIVTIKQIPLRRFEEHNQNYQLWSPGCIFDSQNLFILITESLYPLTNISLLSPPPILTTTV